MLHPSEKLFLPRVNALAYGTEPKKISDRTFRKSYVSLNINICIDRPQPHQPKRASSNIHTGKDPGDLYDVLNLYGVGIYTSDRYAYLFCFFFFPKAQINSSTNIFCWRLYTLTFRVCVCVIHTNINQRHQNNALNQKQKIDCRFP